jgi:hypothetical protein
LTVVIGSIGGESAHRDGRQSLKNKQTAVARTVLGAGENRVGRKGFAATEAIASERTSARAGVSAGAVEQWLREKIRLSVPSEMASPLARSA